MCLCVCVCVRACVRVFVCMFIPIFIADIDQQSNETIVHHVGFGCVFVKGLGLFGLFMLHISSL